LSIGYEDFYSEKYQTGEYKGEVEMQRHPFYSVMKNWIASHEDYVSKKFLEIGSGMGALQDIADDYTGLDYADTVKQYYHKPFFVGSAENMPFQNESFDVVFSYAVWEHIPNPEKAFAEVIRILAKGGIHFASGLALQGLGSRRLSGKTVLRF